MPYANVLPGGGGRARRAATRPGGNAGNPDDGVEEDMAAASGENTDGDERDDGVCVPVCRRG